MTDGKARVRKALKIEDIEMAICFSVMTAWDFDYTKRLEWEIFAARHQECPDCQAPPNHRCYNLSDKTRTKLNKRPHDIRVDWTRLLNGLKQRGYYRPAIEAQVRKMAR